MGRCGCCWDDELLVECAFEEVECAMSWCELPTKACMDRGVEADVQECDMAKTGCKGIGTLLSATKIVQKH